MSSSVQTSYGRIEGEEREGLHVFRGVPYAKPPVGPLRFRAPQRLEPWDGTRDARRFGPRSLQPDGGIIEQLIPSDAVPMDEDCLYLNIWTPGLDNGRRPVMVWIHGGAFVLGAGSDRPYWGGTLALRADVVVVTINYRLGALGFLYHPELADDLHPEATNFGMWDQVAALRWVREEIAAFGGDPNNVTIFGESAGGMSVGAHLGSAASRGLFDKAIPQSGAGHHALTLEQATKTSHSLAEELGIDTLSADVLRRLPAHDIVAAQMALAERRRAEMAASGATLAMPFQPVIDGQFLAQRPIDAIRHGSARGVPLLIGVTAEEWKMFVLAMPGEMTEEDVVHRLSYLVAPHGSRDEERARAVLNVYKSARAARGESVAPTELWSAIGTDQFFRVPADRLAEAQSAYEPRTYSYIFDWKSPLLGGALGACHTIELPFVFGTYAAPGLNMLVGEGPEVEELSRKTQDAWLAFARHGDPSNESLGRWPAFDPEDRRVMVLGAHAHVEQHPREAERRAWDGIL